MAWASRLPAAMDRLFAAFSAAPELEGVTVWDGPSTSQATVTEMVSVGYTGGEDETAAEAEVSPEGYGSNPDRERFTIRCVAAVLVGSSDIAAARRRAYELVAGAGSAIARDRTLGSTVMRAVLGSHALSEPLTDRGAQAVVVFTVECDTYSGR